jgi:acyl-CoA synthetase (AMP-forming)/AMP-acid ligase II
MLFVGIVAAGGVFTGTNPSYTKFELIHHIKTAQAKFFISEPELLDGVLTAAKECGIPNSRVWILDALKQAVPDGFESFQKLMTYGEEDWVRFDDEETCKNTTAARLFSSGTTGLPKAAVITHRNLIAQHTIVHELSPKPFEVSWLYLLRSSLIVTDKTAASPAHVSRCNSPGCAYISSAQRRAFLRDETI